MSRDAERVRRDVEGGLIVADRRVVVPGVDVVTWLDDPELAPRVLKGVERLASDVTAIVLHASRGKRGVIEGESRASTKAAKLARYQVRTEREVSWHLTIGASGDVYQQADAGTWTCWHASHANSWSVGIELAQDRDDPNLTVAQVRACIAVVEALCVALAIPRWVPVSTDGAPESGAVLAWQPRKQGGDAKAVAGVIGHRNLTTRRGVGDPGDPVVRALLDAGFQGVRPVVMTEATTVRLLAGDDPDEPHDEDRP